MSLFLSHFLKLNRSKHNVFQNRHMRKQIKVLEHHSYIFSNLIYIYIFFCDVYAVYNNLACRYILKTVKTS